MSEKYQVVVTEYLRQTVEIDAASEQDAHDRVMEAWMSGEIKLSGRDYDGGDVRVIGLLTEPSNG